MSSINSLMRMGFMVLLLFIVGQGTVVFWAIHSNSQLMEKTLDNDFGSSLLISRIAIEGNKLRRYEKEFFIYVGNAKKMAKYEDEWNASYNKLENMVNEALSDESDTWSHEERLEVQEWKKSMQDYRDGFQRVMTSVYAGVLTDTINANSEIREAKNRFRVLLEGAATGGDVRYQRATAAAEQVEQSNKLLSIVLLGTSAVGVLIAIVLMFKIPSAITDSISVLSRSAEKMSKGHLDEQVPIALAKKEFHVLARTLERMRVSQKTLIKRIRSSTK